MLHFNPPIIGHRGACAYAPENTLASFAKAIQLGLKWVEFDVRQAATGELVIFHDDSLKRTSNGKGMVYKQSFAYLQSLDAGSWFNPIYSGERIPTLLTVLHFLKEAQVAANIEIKAVPGQEERLIKQLLQEMQPFLSASNAPYLFSSFSIPALECLRSHSDHCQIGLLLDEWVQDWQQTSEDLNCTSIHVNHKILTPQKTDYIKNTQKNILCYTVNQLERAQTLFSWGVDAVFSDVPDVLLTYL